MFGRSQEVIFQSYGRRRSRWRSFWNMPRWLLLLLTGIGAGAAAVITVQERYLAPRLSAGESAQLRSAFEQADAERLRLKAALAGANTQLVTVRVESAQRAEDQAAQAATTARLREDLRAVVMSLPPDPRGGTVAVRAGRFTVKGGQLDYSLVLTRERAVGKPMPGALQLLVAGESEAGAPSVVTPQAIPLALGGQEVVRGSLPLPAGFKPRQTTVQVLDRAAGKPLGTRVLLIQ